ncbi:class I SAM-dependent RNA methyltransferase [Kineosporia sp. R_H_3]|uniref:class I SAM-dependent RNA methyltransferase n=2 Tax=unclassified Kineosporia TaxID=2626061 RepID=UPI000B4C1216|nr:TRAM domain-containing protein [Kineosporia sp. R_H_3]
MSGTGTGTPVAGDLVPLEVGPVAHGGHCVARLDGRVVFVRHALPGEQVVARLTEAGAQDRFWRADAVEVLRAAADRVEPRCAVAGPSDGRGRGCGGCDWQHVSTAGQRTLLADVVREQLARLARIDRPDLVVEPVAGDADGLGWRTRVRFAVDAEGRPGLRAHRSHTVVPVEHCPIAHPEVDAVGVGTRLWPGVAAVEVVAGGTSRDGAAAAERLVVVEPVAPPKAPRPTGPAHRSVGKARAARRDGRPGAPAAPVATAAGPTTPAAPVRVDVPPLAAEASVARRDGTAVQRVRGRAWVAEHVVVDGVARDFRVTGGGFWQVHPGAAQTLLDAVLDAAAPQPGERAVDLYCGVGLFSAGLAERVGVTGTVIGVESDDRAVRDARRSLHDLPNVRLVVGRVEKVVTGAATQADVLDRADVVVLDPPRTGAGRAVVTAVLAARPRVVVYVACDPAALARDLATAAEQGYRLDALRAFQLFPMTHHVECVATLVPA